MSPSTSQILRHHDGVLHGTLYSRRIRSRALRVTKPYFVYEPPGVSDLSEVPVVYLFRGHQREWVNMREDTSRSATTAIEDLDKNIASGRIDPVIAVLPGLNSANNHVPSLGVDMVGTWNPLIRGLGTGRFWTYLTDELFAEIDREYGADAGRDRFAVGFSLGGFTASLLAVKLPGYFSHVGIYDGLLMWPRNADPRVDAAHPNTDPVWCEGPIFDAAFGRPRDVAAMQKWNPTDMLVQADEALLHKITTTRFYVASAPNDGKLGNVDRARYFVKLLRERRIPLLFDGVVYDEEARHSWHWTDRFLISFLAKAQTELSGQGQQQPG